MLEAIFGTGKKPDETGGKPAKTKHLRLLTPDAFDRMFSPENDN